MIIINAEYEVKFYLGAINKKPYETTSGIDSWRRRS